MEKKVTAIEYMCTYCGKKVARTVNGGRPDPGKCPRRQREQVHRWVINRKYYSK